MKTHQEIHDAIQHLHLPAETAADFNAYAEILHALNDRIEELMTRQANFEEETRFMVSKL